MSRPGKRLHSIREQLEPGKAYTIDEALEILTQATRRAPNYLYNQIILTVVLSKTGRDAEALQQVREILRISPDYKAENLRKRLPFEDIGITNGFVAALRKAGLP